MCAVGCLIKDEFYTRDIEKQSSSTPKIRDAVEKSLGVELSATTHNVISQLQILHDNTFPFLWKTKLTELAHTHNLNTAAIDNFTPPN